MNQVDFRIRKLSAGWFVSEFSCGGERIRLWASDAWETDTPAHLLELLLTLVTGRRDRGYVIFDEEPGTTVLYLQAAGGADMELFHSSACHDEWEPEALAGRLSKEACKSRLVGIKTLLFVKDFDLPAFAACVAAQFETYVPKHKRDQYEGNWMPFPLSNLRTLQRALAE